MFTPRKILTVLAASAAIVMCGCDAKAFNKAIQKAQQSSSNSSHRVLLTPKAVMQNFIDSLESGDIEEAKSFFCQEMRRSVTDGKLGILAIAFHNARITDVEEDYGSAIVYVRLKHFLTDEEKILTIPMIMESGQWKITNFEDDTEDN